MITLIIGFKKEKEPITEIVLEDVIKELDLTMDEFIDFCILCGCDYTKTIEGMGPSTALKFIREAHTIEGVLELIKEKNEIFREKHDRDKYIVPPPERFKYELARKAFKELEAFPAEDLEVRRSD